jgi:hypothetical protein
MPLVDLPDVVTLARDLRKILDALNLAENRTARFDSRDYRNRVRRAVVPPAQLDARCAALAQYLFERRVQGLESFGK